MRDKTETAFSNMDYEDEFDEEATEDADQALSP